MLSRYWLLWLLLLLGLGSAKAQTVRAVAYRDTLEVGDSLHFSVEVKAPRAAEIYFTAIPDTLAGGLELLAPPRVDTLRYDQDTLEVALRLALTSYDTGWVAIPRIPVLVRNYGVDDTIESPVKLLYVKLVPYDASVGELHPIVGPWYQRVTWAQIWPYLAGLLLLLLLAGAWYWLYRRRKQPRQSQGVTPQQEAPGLVALHRLETLQAQQAWRSEGVKFFYSEDTEALREYLSRIWGLPLLERTTEQALHQLAGVAAWQQPWNETLKAILEQADMVKFAKAQPDATECLRVVTQSIALVKAIEAQRVQVPGSVEAGTGNPLAEAPGATGQSVGADSGASPATVKRGGA